MMVDIAGGGRTGIYTSSWMVIDKVGFALGGSLLLGIILSLFGFDATAAAMQQHQSALAYSGILIGFAIVPALLNLIGAAMIRFSRCDLK